MSQNIFPYLSDIHTQLLELHTGYVPVDYRSLLPFIFYDLRSGGRMAAF